MRVPSPRSWLAVLVLAAAPLVAAADTPAVKWDPARITPPDDVKELRLLQDTVKQVVEKVTSATVAVFFGPGAGSGVIVSEDGLVLTAAHVVSPPESGGPFGRGGSQGPEAPKTCNLQLADGTMVKGLVLGRNPRIDSGMVKITSKVPKDATWPGAKEGKWPSAVVGQSDPVKKGQWVVSLGHPGGPKPERRAPVRVGQVVKAFQKEKVLVSDCTLVGGDSGGPLFDLTGKVIGIHSRIGLYLEDNIHVPAQAFVEQWDDLKDGYLINGDPRPYMGVLLNRDDDSEPKIETVRPRTPAEKAGLEAGDVILKIDGKAVPTSDDVDRLIEKTKPGAVVRLEIQRGDDVVFIDLTIGKVFDARPGTRNRR